MQYVIDKNAPRPSYVQLYEQLRRDITDGAYSYGARLPSKRTLAQETGTSVVTAEHAYALLCDEGYAASREKSGYFVIYKDSDFLSSSEADSAPMAVQSRASAPTGTISFPILAKTMRRVIADKGENILIKSPNHGCPELRRAISSYLARSQGIFAKPRQIIIGSGAEYLYSLIAQLFYGSVFAVENPCYDKIRKVYGACGIETRALKMGRGGIESRALSDTDASVLHVTPFNSYPSGVTAAASKRAEYLKWAAERGGYIIEDNFDLELTVSTKNENTLYSMSGGENVIFMNTFSRTVAPSLRTGYMVLPNGLLESFEERLGFYSCTVPVFEQYVLAELIGSGDFERHVNRVRRKKRQQLSEGK